MSKHTPGPWEQPPAPRSTLDIEAPSAGVIARVEPLGDDAEGWSEALSNARLIAAAPDLLAALEKTLAAYIEASNDAMRIDGEKDEHKLLTFMDDDSIVVMARAALSSATSTVEG